MALHKASKRTTALRYNTRPLTNRGIKRRGRRRRKRIPTTCSKRTKSSASKYPLSGEAARRAASPPAGQLAVTRRQRTRQPLGKQPAEIGPYREQLPYRPVQETVLFCQAQGTVQYWRTQGTVQYRRTQGTVQGWRTPGAFLQCSYKKSYRT